MQISNINLIYNYSLTNKTRNIMMLASSSLVETAANNSSIESIIGSSSSSDEYLHQQNHFKYKSDLRSALDQPSFYPSNNSNKAGSLIQTCETTTNQSSLLTTCYSPAIVDSQTYFYSPSQHQVSSSNVAAFSLNGEINFF